VSVLLPYIGGLRLRDVCNDARAPFRDERAADGAKNETTNRSLEVVRAVLNRAARVQQAQAGPTAGICDQRWWVRSGQHLDRWRWLGRTAAPGKDRTASGNAITGQRNHSAAGFDRGWLAGVTSGPELRPRDGATDGSEVHDRRPAVLGLQRVPRVSWSPCCHLIERRTWTAVVRAAERLGFPPALPRETVGATKACSRKMSPDKEKRASPCGADPLIHFLFFWCGWQESNPRPLGS
jgi:hypothetical protein